MPLKEKQKKMAAEEVLQAMNDLTGWDSAGMDKGRTAGEGKSAKK